VVLESTWLLLTLLFSMIMTGIQQWTHKLQIEHIVLVKLKKFTFTDLLLKIQSKKEFWQEPGRRKMFSRQFTEQIWKLILSAPEM
jgi:hypothetical protein